jgi:hypothetical protein
MSHDDFAYEPIRGLPAVLPPGEKLLWQGAPAWRALAISAYHVRKVGIYFVLLALWRIGIGLADGDSARVVGVSCAWLLAMGAVAAVLLTVLALLSARTTVYSITSGRIIIRFGIAFPMTINIPFSLLESADLKLRRSGDGDLLMSVRADQRLGYLVTWPHVRPWRFKRPEPSFRALTDAPHAAAVLAQAMKAYAEASALPIAFGVQPAAAPQVGAQNAAAA